MLSNATSHETFIQSVRDLVLAHSELSAEQAAQLHHAKLVYGVGNGAYRGITCYQAWRNGVGTVDVIEIAATGEESWIQLAGTTIHELAHVLAGHGAGHGSEWKDLAVQLGFTKRPEAAGQVYRLAMIRPALRHAIARLAAELADGSPAFLLAPSPVAMRVPRPCSQGTGTRGGKSRGKGSGSRMRLWECQCPKPVKVRVASDDFAAHCDQCGSAFVRKS
ncbi:MAG: hypothetical protein ACREKH_15375 [Candidatus Rokuibacteriota bacterium]